MTSYAALLDDEQVTCGMVYQDTPYDTYAVHAFVET